MTNPVPNKPPVASTIIYVVGIGCLLVTIAAPLLRPKASPAAPPENVAPVGVPVAPVAKPSTPVAQGEDVLDKVLHANSSAFPAPPTKFHAGHVTLRHLDPKMIHAAQDGFTVKFPSGAPIVTPTVYDGMVLSSGGFNSREFYAFDAQSGAPRWGIDLDDDGPSVAACEEGLCAFDTESCTLFVVDAKTGNMAWSLYLGDPLTTSPTIMQGKVFTSYPAPGHSHATHVLAAFDLKTGKILWQRWLDADIMSAPVAIGTQLYASTFAGTLYVFDSQSGEIKSAHRVRATSAPTISGDQIAYSQRSEGKGAAPKEVLATQERHSGKSLWRANDRDAPYLDDKVQGRSELAEKGKQMDAKNGFSGGAPVSAHADAAKGMLGKSSVSTMQSHQGSRVLKLGDESVSAQGDELVAVNKEGKVAWHKSVAGDMQASGGALAAPPVAAGGRIVLATLAGTILELDGVTGAVRHEYHAGGQLHTQPAVMNGWIYAGTDDGKLIAIDTHDATLTGWSTWGGDSARSNVR